MFKVALMAAACLASPALAQVTIAENGIQIAEPEPGFSLYEGGDSFMARLWVHNSIERFSILILDKQDPENAYTGMDWDERAWDPIISQAADISSYYQGAGWMIAEGDVCWQRLLSAQPYQGGLPCDCHPHCGIPA